MKYQPLGNSTIRISEVGFGCSSLERDRQKSVRLIREAVDEGVNFFDTADLYDKGWNEETVGEALNEVRNQVVISTKVGNRWRPDGTGWDWIADKSYILSAVNKSLKRLKTDRIDLYMLHGGTLDDPTDEIIEAFEHLQEAGKIRLYGISSIRPSVIRQYINRSNISSVMMQYSLLDRRPEEECLKQLQDAGISVLTRGSLAKGRLIDKTPAEYLGFSAEDVAAVQASANATGNPVGASLQFVLDHPAVTSAAVGIRTQVQLKSVLGGYRQQVSPDVIERLRRRLEPAVYEKHR
ncbi:MAG: aldo/keto reductase [Balneolaceae bacterium]